MKCPFCVKPSTLTDLGGSRTLAYSPPFYDEDGEYHLHDPNYGVHEYRCSNGHRYRAIRYNSCRCGWVGGEDTVALV